MEKKRLASRNKIGDLKKKVINFIYLLLFLFFIFLIN